MAHILLVEGEAAVALPLARALARAGHRTTVAATGSDALALVDDGPVDLALVDETLPDADGHTVVAALHQYARAPVVVLSASREQADRDAWRNGAEDYLVKPVGEEEVVKLVGAVLRRWRSGGGYGEVLRIGAVELDTLLREVRIDGRSLKLPPKEIAVLARLMRDAGDAVSRDELMLEAWGELLPSGSRTLDVHIATLRSHLGDDEAPPRLIETVRGVGFRFNVRPDEHRT